MLVINTAFEIRLEKAGVKFYSFHITFQLVDKFYFFCEKSFISKTKSFAQYCSKRDCVSTF